MFAGEGASAIHLFGSLARGDGDDLSDIDLWITVPDDQITQLIERRFEIFNNIAEVVIHHEAPRNRPLGGSYTLVIHRVGSTLIQADYYLAPASTSVILPEARHLSGNDAFRRGSWVLDTAADTVEDFHERIDFLICMSFIGIKKILRGDYEFLDFLDREYGKFLGSYDVPHTPKAPTRDLDALAGRLHSILLVADERQSEAILAIIDGVRPSG